MKNFIKVPNNVGIYTRESVDGTITFYVTYKKSGFVRVGSDKEGYSLDDAVGFREVFISDLTKTTNPPKGIDTVDNLFRSYLAHKELSSISTAMVDKSVYQQHISKHIGNDLVRGLNRAKIERFLGTLTQVSPQTKQRVLHAISRAIGYYINLGNDIKDPTKGIVIKLQGFKKERVLTRYEIEKMLDWCEVELDKGEIPWLRVKELQLQILMGVQMGLRRSELWTSPETVERFGVDRSLVWNRVMWDEKKIRLVRKGNITQVMVIPPTVFSELENFYRDVDKTCPKIFSCFQLDLFRMMVRELGFNKGLDYQNRDDRQRWVSFHTLRHTFGSIVLDQTKDLLLVSKLMNHSYQQTTLLYAHLLNNKEEEAMELVSGFFE